MKNSLLFLISYFYVIQLSFAEQSAGIFQGSNVSGSDLRNGNIHTEDIPNMIKSSINFFMGIAGTVAIIFVIIGAYKILFGSLQQDKTKGKDTIIMAIMGFILASLSWFIIKLIIDNFS